MMPNSVFATVEDRDRYSDHFPLGQGQITVAMHDAVVKRHQRSEGMGVQAVSLDDMIDAPPGAHRPFVDFANNTGRFVLVYVFNPHDNLSLVDVIWIWLRRLYFIFDACGRSGMSEKGKDSCSERTVSKSDCVVNIIVR